MITTVLAFVLTLGVLIVIHEYGHYRVAGARNNWHCRAASGRIRLHDGTGGAAANPH